MRKYLLSILLINFWGCEEAVEEDTTPPTVSIQSPITNQSIHEIVTIVVETDDNEGISKVEFYIDDSLYYTDTESPYEYEWNTSQYEDNSEHIVKVISYDNSDNYTTSQPISYIVDNSTSIPTSSQLYPVAYDNGFQIIWSKNIDDDFQSYKLYESLSDDMSNQTLVFETTEKGDTNYVVMNLYNSQYRYYKVETNDYSGLVSSSNTIVTYHDNCEPLVDLNGNNVFDSDVGESFANIVGNLVLIDFGLDGVLADDVNGDGDYDDEGDIAPDFGEGNGIWDGESFEDLNQNLIWDCY